MPKPEQFDQLMRSSAKLLAKTDALSSINFARYQVEIRLVYYAQKLETDRAYRHAQRMESALNQLIVHVVVSVVTLGLTAAVEAVMAGAYAAEGAYATAHGVRYARAAAELERALATKNVLQRVAKVVEIAKNPALRNILLEYKAVELMVKAPALGINKALEAWTQHMQGKEYEFEVPDLPESDDGTFFRDDKGKLRKPGWEFLKVAKQVYDRWGAEQASERAFLEEIAKLAANAYQTDLTQDLGSLSNDCRSLLALNRSQFSGLDGVLEKEVAKLIAQHDTSLDQHQKTLAVATALRGYWLKPFGELSERETRLRIEIQSLSQEVTQLKRAVQLQLNRAPALPPGRRGMIPMAEPPGRYDY